MSPNLTTKLLSCATEDACSPLTEQSETLADVQVVQFVVIVVECDVHLLSAPQNQTCLVSLHHVELII